MSRGPLFKGARDGFSMPRCAHCQNFIVGVCYVVTTGKEKFKVCSWACEKALKAAHEVKEAEALVEKL